MHAYVCEFACPLYCLCMFVISKFISNHSYSSQFLYNICCQYYLLIGVAVVSAIHLHAVKIFYLLHITDKKNALVIQVGIKCRYQSVEKKTIVYPKFVFKQGYVPTMSNRA